MKKYDFSKPPQNYEARMEAMGEEFVQAVMGEALRFIVAQGTNLGVAALCTIFTSGFLRGQEFPIEKPKKKKVPTES